MTVEAVGIGTLSRLAQLDVDGHPVLSVYLDLDPSRFPTPATRTAQLGGLLGQAHHEGARRELGEIRELLAGDPEIARGAHGLAIFACADAGVLEAVPLPIAVEPIAVVDSVPWLEPLAGMITSHDWGVAVVSRSGARLFRGGPQELIEFATVHDDVHKHHAQGGWSQSRYQRGIEEEVAVHVRRVGERLERAHRRRPFDHLVIVATDGLRPVVEHNLTNGPRQVLAGIVDGDLEHATVEEIATAVRPVIDRAHRELERELVARIDAALAAGGPAAAGFEEVLAMLEERRVETVLVPGHATDIDGRAHIVEQAARQSVRVVVITEETDWLAAHGSFAAVLRW